MTILSDIAADIARHPYAVAALVLMLIINTQLDRFGRVMPRRWFERHPRLAAAGLFVAVGAGLINAAVYLVEFAGRLL